MLPFAYYLLKVIVCSAILYGYYWFFLRNKIFHQYNRFYLLAVVVLSLTLPLLKFNILHNADVPKTSMIKMLQVVSGGDAYMDEVILYSSYSKVNKEQMIMAGFILICLVFAFIFIRTLIKIYHLRRNNPTENYEGIMLINTHDKSTPFSFLKNIFWNEGIDISTSNGQRILKHELAHVEEKHSHDKLFINLVLIVFWSNPVFWLLRKELNLIHEFTADKKAVEDGDTAAFAAMILQATYPRHQFDLTNNFFYSPIKRRLAMLTKNNKKVSYISRLLVLPLTVLVFAAFTLKTKTIPGLQDNKTITVVLDAGHGGTDIGAISTDGTKEKDITLMLAKKIKELNTNQNVKILLIRETDIYQTPKQKTEIAQKMGADLFISVHVDNGPKKDQSERSGISVWVARDIYSNATSSKLLASALIGSFKSGYGLPVEAQPMQQEKTGIWVLQELSVPSVLIESGFLNNKKDLAYLKSAAGQEAFANKVLEAIYNYATNAVIEERIPADNKVMEVPVAKDKVIEVEIKKEDVTNQLNGEVKEVAVARKREYNIIAADSLIVDASQHIGDNNKSLLPAGVRIRGVEGQAKPVYVLNGDIVDIEGIQSIDPQTVSTVHVIRGTTAVAKYGDKAKDGAIEIITKSKTEFPVNIQSNNASSFTNVKSTAVEQKDVDRIFVKLEEEAKFPGGVEAWTKYLKTNLDAKMPLNEKFEAGTHTVLVRFIVNTDGTVRDITTENYKGTKTAQMCIDIIKKGPKWIPGKQNGFAVNSYRKQPITFVVGK